MQVIQPVLEVFLPVTERNNDGHLVGRDAVLGGIAAAHLHLWVLFLHKLQVHRHVKLDHHGADYRGGRKEKLAGYSVPPGHSLRRHILLGGSVATKKALMSSTRTTDHPRKPLRPRQSWTAGHAMKHASAQDPLP